MDSILDTVVRSAMSAGVGAIMGSIVTAVLHRTADLRAEDARLDKRYASLESHQALSDDVKELKGEIRDMLPRMHKENSDRADLGNEKLTAMAVAIARIEGALGTKSK